MMFRLFGPDEAAELRDAVREAACVPGRTTGVGLGLHGIKSTLQVEFESPAFLALTARVKAAMRANRDLVEFARPRRWAKMRFAKYGVASEYGAHVDAPIFYQGGLSVRTDLAFTLALSEPDSYEGGELLLADSDSDARRSVRPAAGMVEIYPATRIHRVSAVTEGERVVCAGWVQSAIRRSEEREILFDLTRLREGVAPGEPRLRLEKSIANLVKLWSE